MRSCYECKFFLIIHYTNNNDPVLGADVPFFFKLCYLSQKKNTHAKFSSKILLNKTTSHLLLMSKKLLFPLWQMNKKALTRGGGKFFLSSMSFQSALVNWVLKTGMASKLLYTSCCDALKYSLLSSF